MSQSMRVILARFALTAHIEQGFSRFSHGSAFSANFDHILTL
ncbi:hypothetical protein [Endozoicomonas sp. 8E]|nr:hypothetical protein [Endozoicomonas sp. 8E]WOG30252.1 hypothetical protein P6910_11600 [Endozoicomonas sp. 8E]